MYIGFHFKFLERIVETLRYIQISSPVVYRRWSFVMTKRVAHLQRANILRQIKKQNKNQRKKETKTGRYIVPRFCNRLDLTLETSLLCILLSASRDVHFDKRMICFLSGLF